MFLLSHSSGIVYVYVLEMQLLKSKVDSLFILQDPEILQTQSNEILTAIVHGMKKEETRYLHCFFIINYVQLLFSFVKSLKV